MTDQHRHHAVLAGASMSEINCDLTLWGVTEEGHYIVIELDQKRAHTVAKNVLAFLAGNHNCECFEDED